MADGKTARSCFTLRTYACCCARPYSVESIFSSTSVRDNDVVVICEIDWLAVRF